MSDLVFRLQMWHCYRTKSCRNSSLCSAIKNINHFLTASFVDQMHFIHLIGYSQSQTQPFNTKSRSIFVYIKFVIACWNKVLKLWYIDIVSVGLKFYCTVRSRFKKYLNLQNLQIFGLPFFKFSTLRSLLNEQLAYLLIYM